jgi:MFS family permease
MLLTHLTKRKWIVLSGLFLIYMASNGITLHTLPLLYPELIESFGWQASQVTLPATVFFLIGAMTSPPAGWLLDKYSPRKIILVGSLTLSVALIGFSQVQELWQLVSIYALLGLGLSLCGLVSNMVVLTAWFDERRGRATGILLMASSLGGVLFPLAVGAALTAYGWRSTMLGVGFFTGTLMIGSAWFLLRDTRTETPLDAYRSAKSITQGFAGGLTDVLKQINFYKVLFLTGSLWFVIIALTQHQSIYLTQDVGLPKAQLPGLFSLFFACSVLGKLGFGVLSEYFSVKRVMAASNLTLATALFFLTQVSAESHWLLLTYAAIAGVGFSGAFTCIQLLVAYLYRGPSYGRILAIVVLIDTLCGALGTRLLGLAREFQGDYRNALAGLIALSLTATVLVMTLKTNNTGGRAPARPKA